MAILLALLVTLPAPVAAKTFTPPEGCTLFMTVQARACRVSSHYKCVQDPAGDQWRADFDQEGVYFLSRIDAEAQWIESYDLYPTTRQSLDANPNDPASFSELLTTGTDTFAFGLTKDDGSRTRVSGFDTLTGTTVTIDGIALKETQFEFTETDLSGTITRQSRGREYIHPDWRLFFAGPSEWDGGTGEYVPIDGSPRMFFFPGEPGFAATEPLYECDAILSSFPVPAQQFFPQPAKAATP